jgi:LPS-assembly protein
MSRPDAAGRPDVRSPRWGVARSAAAMALACILGIGAVLAAGSAGHAQAPAPQQPQQQPQPTAERTPDPASELGLDRDPNARMLLQADELVYDTDRDVVSAIGNVEIYYQGYTLIAGRVTLDRKTNRLKADDGVQLTEPDGNVVTAASMDLSDDFRDGFVASLRVDTIQRTRFAAEAGTREAGETIIFEKGVYSACSSCIVDPSKRPLWVLKARRIIHKKSEQTVYYEDPRLEFLGVPVAWVPRLSMPDPSVRRKSGLLAPYTIYSEQMGFGVAVPYFWAPAPNYDLTLTATGLSRQGALMEGAWRQRMISGSYDIRLAGIFQADPEAFVDTDGNRDFRGLAASKGEFWLNQRWKWGWDVEWTTDQTFVKDYKREGSGKDEAISTLYLTGLGDRNYFDIRAYAFRVYQQDMRLVPRRDIPRPFTAPGIAQQAKQPIVHPVLDYSGIWDRPVLGGEFAWNTNVTSLTREQTDAFLAPDGTIRYRGVEGTYSRFTAEATWRREIIGPLGQVITPFAGLRGDLFQIDSPDSRVRPLRGENFYARGMPMVGLEWRYPWLIGASWGTQVIEPIAQIIARPNETGIGELPNEDAQSIVFDDTTLFEWDKFSGFDRVEGGTRANVGMQYTAQLDRGGAVTAMFGRSYQIAGRNSFEVPDIMDSTANSGLNSDASDYVTRLAVDTQSGLRIGGRARFDNKTFDLRRAEVATTGVAGPVTAQVLYAFLGKQPGLGIRDDRQEVQTSAALRILPHWRTFGTIRYDLEGDDMVANGYGLAFDDDSFSASVAYAEDRSGATGIKVDRTIFFRFGLRTIGDAELSTGN